MSGDGPAETLLLAGAGRQYVENDHIGGHCDGLRKVQHERVRETHGVRWWSDAKHSSTTVGRDHQELERHPDQ